MTHQPTAAFLPQLLFWGADCPFQSMGDTCWCPSDPEILGKSKLGAGVCSTAKLGLTDHQQCSRSQPQLVPLATFLEFHFSAALSLQQPVPTVCLGKWFCCSCELLPHQPCSIITDVPETRSFHVSCSGWGGQGVPKQTDCLGVQPGGLQQFGNTSSYSGSLNSEPPTSSPLDAKGKGNVSHTASLVCKCQVCSVIPKHCHSFTATSAVPWAVGG